MRDPNRDVGGYALWGADGTQSPNPLPMFPDALSGIAAPVDRQPLAPMELPPAPDAGAIQEAIAAALSDEPAGAPPPRRRRPPPPPPRPAQQPWGTSMPGPNPRMFTASAAGLQRRPPPSPYAPPHRGGSPSPPAPYTAGPRRNKLGIGCALMLIFAVLVVFTVLAEAIAGLG